jgi:glutamate-ammonia-ligase adenylyltransferase
MLPAPAPPFTANWPPPADQAGAARLAEAFGALGPAQKKFARTPAGQAVLACLGGNAPYLADLALQESHLLLRILRDGPDACFAGILYGLHRMAANAERQTIARRLRLAKRRAALTIALADLGGVWSLPQITGALSGLAEAALRVAVRHLLRTLHGQRLIKLPDPANPEQNCGFVALALGKLGALELNYSSDIDLVLLYDEKSPVYSGQVQATMARLARDLATLLMQRDEYGYVFRVDLRLRPDPGATPPVISLGAALAYFESHGRTWERAAYSKARPVAGDIALGREFLYAIRPFIWRRHLDFAAIADIHDMKRQIDEKQARQSLLGFDVKLGRGGIREIEFIVQTLSLVWGGQDPALRIPATLQALPALADAGHLPEPVALELAADYRQLRRVEHRLQMIADRQTHALPTAEAALAAFAVFMNEPDFAEKFPKILARVHEHFRAFFDAGAAAEQQHALDPGGDGAAPAAFAAHLKDLGFKDIQHVTERVRDWLSGRISALRSDRARELLTALLPALLAALGRQPEPDRAFLRFDSMIARQRAGVQLLSLFQRNPALLDRLAAVLGAAPALAEHLTQDAQALEALLAPDARFTAPKPILTRILRDARDLEDAVTLTRQFVRREEFHLSVATLEGRLDANEAGRLRSKLAAAALSGLLPRVVAAHERRHGHVRGGAFAVVALGKTGSSEMLAGSDLDLMLIYDHSPAETAPVQNFVRLAHAFTGVLTAQGPEGPLYKIDMRLRPSGNQGPVAVSLNAFRRYHAVESWTWERLALTRARVMAATPHFAEKISAEILHALYRETPPATIRADTLAMRDRLAADLPPAGPFDVKHLPGGLLELSFIAEALQLIHGPANPALFRVNTSEALRTLANAGHLVPHDAQALIAADFFWRTIQGINRITGLADKESTPQPVMLAPLLRATGLPDLDALKAGMAQTAQTVRDCFERYITTGVRE